MSDLIKSLYQLTDELYNHLQLKPNKDKREQYIDTIQVLLDKRQLIINQLKNVDLKNIKLSKEFHDKDQEIGKLMNLLLLEIQSDIQQINQKKLANQKYNHYLSGDGMFFDKRK